MFRRLLIFLAILAGLAVAADRGLAAVAGNATAAQVRLHEGLREDPDVTFRGFPFVTQAVHGRFRAVDVTARDVERDGLTVDRIDAHLEGVKIDLGRALKGRVSAVPIQRGRATVTLTYADLGAYLARKPGNIRLAVRAGQVYVTSTYGVTGLGQVEVEGTPSVRVSGDDVRVTVSNVRAVAAGTRLTAAQAGAAGARASFTIPLSKLPFGITVESARLTGEALVVAASAEGLVVDLRR
ncbi:MAG TPA: DUF2993 domain-containing protein [Mycobacteriales bacterium]|nr:DUF2993 domain-containing protein [Mycobacteriales bacterium]